MTKHDRIDLVSIDFTNVLTDAHWDEHLIDSLLLAVKEDGAPQADKKIRILLQTNFTSTIVSQKLNSTNSPNSYAKLSQFKRLKFM